MQSWHDGSGAAERAASATSSFASTSAFTLNSTLADAQAGHPYLREAKRRYQEYRHLAPVTALASSLGATADSRTITARRTPPVCETDDVSAASAAHPPPANQRAAHAQLSDEEAKRISQKRSWSYVIRSGLAGGVAGCVAKTSIAPLDRVKILFQAQNPEYQKYSGKWTGVFTAGREIMRNDGVTALFQGHSATLLRIFPYAAIKYMAYDSLHFLLMPTKDQETSARLFVAGAASGVTSVFITYPLELIRVRLAFETKRKRQKGSLARIIRKIYAEGSTEAPFSGDARKRAGQRATSAAATGGATSTVAAANLSTSAVQHAAIANGATVASPIPTSPIPSQTAMATQRILHQFPILKFYRGFTVTVMGMIPYAGTSFLVFGRCKTIMQSWFGPEAQLKKRQAGIEPYWQPSKTTIDLSAGALAGAISQTAAYPFEVIRRRQQIGGIIRPQNILGVSETALWIWRTSGWRGFYVGLSIGFLKVVPMTSISFAVWMAMKRSMGI